MFVKFLSFLSIKWALFYTNHMTGQHVSGAWLKDLKYNRQGE